MLAPSLTCHRNTMNTRKRIAILYTGGTIGMMQTEHGLAPCADLGSRAQTWLGGQMDTDWHLAAPLIDSSALTLADWQRWLAWLHQHLDKYDGVLILHGTDTLAYSANLLALALAALNKPVVLTGAQWPLGAPGSDAPLNLQTALAAFNLPDLKHVAIAFNGTLFRAVGSSKVSTEHAAGFATPHFAPLGQWQPESGWQQLRLHELPPPLKPAAQATAFNPAVNIVCHTLTPGANSAMIAHSLQHFAADGVVLSSYGHGNAPADAELLAAITAVCARGVPVLNISQVAEGCAAAVYAQGSALRAAGVINGGKCNRETAIALLTLAAANRWAQAQIEQMLRHWQLWV